MPGEQNEERETAVMKPTFNEEMIWCNTAQHRDVSSDSDKNYTEMFWLLTLIVTIIQMSKSDKNVY